MSGPLHRVLNTLAESKSDAAEKSSLIDTTFPSSTNEQQQQTPTVPPSIKKIRQKHHVSKLSDRLRIVKWMVNQNQIDFKKLATKTIKQFPEAPRFEGSKLYKGKTMVV